MAKKLPKEKQAATQKYSDDMGRRIVELMEQGYSLRASAAHLGVGRTTIYLWERTRPEFAASLDVARGKRQHFLETRLLGATASPVVTSSIFALKNAAPDDWLERSRVEHTAADGAPLIEPSDLELAQAVFTILARATNKE